VSINFSDDRTFGVQCVKRAKCENEIGENSENRFENKKRKKKKETFEDGSGQMENDFIIHQIPVLRIKNYLEIISDKEIFEEARFYEKLFREFYFKASS